MREYIVLVTMVILASFVCGCEKIEDREFGDKEIVKLCYDDTTGVVLSADSRHHNSAIAKREWRYRLRIIGVIPVESDQDRDFETVSPNAYLAWYFESELESTESEKDEFDRHHEPESEVTKSVSKESSPTTTSFICQGVVNARDIEFNDKSNLYRSMINTKDGMIIGIIMSDRSIHDKYVDGEKVKVKISVIRE